MDKRDWIKEQLDKLSDTEYVKVWNEYCYENGYTDGVIHPMEEFNDMMGAKTPLEIADAVRGGNFNPNDDWLVHKEMYGDEIVSDCDARYLSEEWDLIDYILENITGYEHILNDAEYRDAMLEDMDDSERVPFESWFDNTYTCYMYELDLDDLINEWQEYKQNMEKFAIFIGGQQITDFNLTRTQADRAAGNYREDGENGVEIVPYEDYAQVEAV